MKRRTIYYTDELNDDFAGTNIVTKETPADYRYVRKNPLWHAAAFLLYHVVARPFAFAWAKLRYGLRVVGREKLRAARGKGVFLFGNHTLMAGDAFHPNLVTPGRRTYIVTGADAVSVRGLRNVVAMLGAMPLPSGRAGYRNFLAAMKSRIARGKAIVIFPEAHIWPYYTGIRPFGSAPFLYPVTTGAPSYAITTVFSRRGARRAPRVTLYVDGPFFPDASLSPGAARDKLRDEVYAAMTARAEKSECDLVTYVRAENADRAEAESVGEAGEAESA